MKKILLIVCILLLVGCNSPKSEVKEPEVNKPEEVNDIKQFKSEYESLNESTKINVNIKETYKLKTINTLETAQFLESGTGIVYFGYPSCPWCRNMVSILLDTATKNNIEVKYLNVMGLKNDNDENYKKIMTILDKYLETSEGKKTLFVPDVYFIKDGKITGHHLGTVDTQNDASISLDDNQVKELTGIYQNLMEDIK